MTKVPSFIHAWSELSPSREGSGPVRPMFRPSLFVRLCEVLIYRHIGACHTKTKTRIKAIPMVVDPQEGFSPCL